MTKSILQVYEDKAGRLFFHSDLSETMPEKDRAKLIMTIAQAIRGNGQVCSAIRQLALGSVLCNSDVEAQKRAFRADVARFFKLCDALNAKKGKYEVL